MMENYNMTPDSVTPRACCCTGRSCLNKDCEAHPYYDKNARGPSMLEAARLEFLRTIELMKKGCAPRGDE